MSSKKDFPHFPTYGIFFAETRNLFARKSLLLPNNVMGGEVGTQAGPVSLDFLMELEP